MLGVSGTTDTLSVLGSFCIDAVSHARLARALGSNLEACPRMGLESSHSPSPASSTDS